MTRNRRNEGLTLIELMISVAIIGILAATSIALFQDQQFRAKRTEGLTNLEAIAKMERAYFAEQGAYLEVIVPGGITPVGPLARQWANVASPTFQVLGFRAEGVVFYDYDVAAAGGAATCAACASQNCFTVGAVGDLDGDGGMAILAYAHPDSAGSTCEPQIGPLTPPTDPNTGRAILDAPGRYMPPFSDNY